MHNNKARYITEIHNEVNYVHLSVYIQYSIILVCMYVYTKTKNVEKVFTMYCILDVVHKEKQKKHENNTKIKGK